MKKSIFVLPLVAALAGCGPKETYAIQAKPITGQEYTGSRMPFSLTVPDGWETNESGVMGTLVIFLSQKEGPSDRFQENVNVVEEVLPRQITNARQYYDGALEMQKKLLTDSRLLGSGPITLGSTPAYASVYTFRMGNLELKQINYLLVEDGKGYVITGSALPESFDRYKQTFAGIAASLKAN